MLLQNLKSKIITLHTFDIYFFRKKLLIFNFEIEKKMTIIDILLPEIGYF